MTFLKTRTWLSGKFEFREIFSTIHFGVYRIHFGVYSIHFGVYIVATNCNLQNVGRLVKESHSNGMENSGYIWIPKSRQHTTGTGTIASWSNFSAVLSMFGHSGRLGWFSDEKTINISCRLTHVLGVYRIFGVYKIYFGVYKIYFGVYIDSKAVKFVLFRIFMTFLVLHVFTKNIEKTEFQTSTHSSATITKWQNSSYQASEVAVPIPKRLSTITIWDRNSVESNFIDKGVASPRFRDRIYLL